jgi:hypothetical protein
MSCNSNEKTEKINIATNELKTDNITEITSTDIEKLSEILDFGTHKPIKVEFKYVFIDNSGQNDRLSVPGPSDYYLEAILYFNDQTFRAMNAFELNLEWKQQHHNKQEFNFDWLPKHIIEELGNHNIENYKGHPDFFFGTGVNGKAWYLENKILLQEYTN